jgi:hypothetical protein
METETHIMENANRFDKNLFDYHGGYLTYGQDRRFVARFKYRGPVTRAKFMAALVKHYDPDSYFLRLKGTAPLQILMDDGILVFDREVKAFTLDGKVL